MLEFWRLYRLRECSANCPLARNECFEVVEIQTGFQQFRDLSFESCTTMCMWCPRLIPRPNVVWGTVSAWMRAPKGGQRLGGFGQQLAAQQQFYRVFRLDAEWTTTPAVEYQMAGKGIWASSCRPECCSEDPDGDGFNNLRGLMGTDPLERLIVPGAQKQLVRARNL